MTHASITVTRQTGARRHGLTLVETLVVLAVVAALFAITIPVLRGVLAQSQTTQNLSNMSQTMKDFFTWSAANNGRMVNWGLPKDQDNGRWPYANIPVALTFEAKAFAYTGQIRGWPGTLHHAFGEASPHWQSTYADPTEELPPGMTLADVRRIDPTWEWRVASDYLYSFTMVTKPNAWVFPGLALDNFTEFAEYYAYIAHADIAHPSGKGVLWHDHIEPGPGQQRQIAFADGAVSQRDILAARPAAAYPMSVTPNERNNPIASTLRGALGIDY